MCFFLLLLLFLFFDVNYYCCCFCCCCYCCCYCCCCCCCYCCVVVVTEEYFCVNDKLIIFVDTKDIFRFKLCTRAITMTYMNPFWFLYQFWCFLFFNFPKTINNNWLEKGSKKMRMPYTVSVSYTHLTLPTIYSV